MDPNDEYGANLPLKDYGKRKPNDAVDNVPQQSAAKKMRYESSATSNDENSTKSVPQPEESKNQKKKKKARHDPQPSTATQSTNNSQQFDYGQVDFKKFKGGSHQAKRNDNEVHTKFHGKVIFCRLISIRYGVHIGIVYFQNKHHANNKKFNKLFTFSGMQSKGHKKK